MYHCWLRRSKKFSGWIRSLWPSQHIVWEKWNSKVVTPVDLTCSPLVIQSSSLQITLTNWPTQLTEQPFIEPWTWSSKAIQRTLKSRNTVMVMSCRRQRPVSRPWFEGGNMPLVWELCENGIPPFFWYMVKTPSKMKKTQEEFWLLKRLVAWCKLPNGKLLTLPWWLLVPRDGRIIQQYRAP